MRFCCPHLSSCNLPERFNNTISEKSKKFEQLFDFVKKNKKFPDFPICSQYIDLFLRKLGFVKKNGFNKQKYEANCSRIEKFKNDETFDKNLKNQILEYLHQALEYQREFFVFPMNAEWFNKYSDFIFAHLEKSQ